MPYVQIPRDLNKVKVKFFLGLTKRQVLWFGIGIAVGIVPFFLLVNVNLTGAVTALFLCVVPFGFCGMYEKNGMTFDKIITKWLKANVLRTKLRPYKTENIYTDMEEQSFIDKEAKRVGYKKSFKDRILGAVEKTTRIKKKIRK